MKDFLDIISEALSEGQNSSTEEIYHWATTESMLGILQSGMINSDTTHSINGRTLTGVSFTRDAYLDLSNTYAVGGRRPWRIGMNLRAINNRYKVMPIRDEYLRKVPRGDLKTVQNGMGMFGTKYEEKVSSDECEEFVLGSIPLKGFISSIAVEDQWVDATVHPGKIAADADYYSDNFEIESADHDVLFGMLTQCFPEFMEVLLSPSTKFAKDQKKHMWSAPRFSYPKLPNGGMVPLLLLYRDSYAVKLFKDVYKWVLDKAKK